MATRKLPTIATSVKPRKLSAAQQKHFAPRPQKPGEPKRKSGAQYRRERRLKELMRLEMERRSLQDRTELHEASAAIPEAMPGTKYVEGELMPVRYLPGRGDRPVTNFGDNARTGMGRPKGSSNKVTKEVKQVIAECFTKIGGLEAFAEWARKNQTKFYYIYAKLLPIQLQAHETKDINIFISKDEANI